MLFQLVQAGYWLALSVWFGSVVLVAVVAGVVLRVLKEERPVLPQVLAVNLEDQHAVLLGSGVMAAVLAAVGRVQVACAAAVVLGTGLHFAVANVGGANLTAAVVRVVLAVLAAGVLGYDRFVVAPRLSKARRTYVENADEPDVANPAKEAFDRDQHLTLSLLMLAVCLLAGLVLFSAAITPAPVYRAVGE